MSEIDLAGGGSNLPIITTRKPAHDPALAWGDHYRTVGIHDFPDTQVWDSGNSGWVVHTALVGEEPPFDLALRHIRSGGGLFVRLNEEYGRTIPTDKNQWQAWANKAGNYLWRLMDYLKRQLPNSHPATIVCCIGNEMNAAGEWGGVEITPERYAEFFNLCYRTIKAAMPNVLLSPGAIAWYGPTQYANGRYLTPRQWWDTMIANIVDLDAITLHTYSHTNNPVSVTWDRKFGDWPMDDIHYDFQNYRDQMAAIPERWRFLPVYISETNAGAELTQTPAWRDERSGWIVEAYREIARWNAEPHNQQIHMLALFCWLNRTVGIQEYGIRGKHNVIGEFIEAQRTVDNRRFVPNWLPPYANWSYQSQNAPGAWKYSADCGHACVRMILDWAQKAPNVTIDQLTDMVRQSSAGYTTGYDLVRLFGLYGLTAQYVNDQTPERGDICLINYGQITQRYDKGFTGLHWLIYLGDKDNNVVTHDPDYFMVGNTGRNREYYLGDWQQAFTGWVVRVQW